jgi:uncharacterized iron-regulated membrane protein
MNLHKHFLMGETGVMINGLAGLGAILVLMTGLILWWPGIGQWQSAIRVRWRGAWRTRFWELHRAMGFWTFAAMLMFAFSGLYLCFPETFHMLADRIEPYDPDSVGVRIVDELLYWLAFLHFGRINGIGLFCACPGICDQLVKATWALLGLAPAAMLVTGATVWWQRVMRSPRQPNPD